MIKKIAQKATLLAVCSIVLSCAGCDKEIPGESWQQAQDEKDRQVCRDAGGIPLSSVWTGFMKDCKFPPKQ